MKNRHYLTKDVNVVFEINRVVMGGKGDKKENGPEEISEPSSVVERNLSISNLKLTRDLQLVSNFYYFLRAKGLIKNGAKIIETESIF